MTYLGTTILALETSDLFPQILSFGHDIPKQQSINLNLLITSLLGRRNMFRKSI
jgi:hypothetical protein